MTILTLLFLAFCALIVVFQAVPAVLMFIGMVKGFTAKPKEVIK